jgi:hypothetical protein
MCVDSIHFEQLMPYIWKKVGVLWRVFKFTISIVKIIVFWTWMLNLLEDPHTNLLYIFFVELNLNLPHP